MEKAREKSVNRGGWLGMMVDKCWMMDVGFWIEKDKKTQRTQRDDGGFFTLIKKRLSY